MFCFVFLLDIWTGFGNKVFIYDQTAVNQGNGPGKQEIFRKISRSVS